MWFREELAYCSINNTPNHVLCDRSKMVCRRLFDYARNAAREGKFSFDTTELSVENEAADQWAFIYGLKVERIDVNGNEYRRISWDGRLV